VRTTCDLQELFASLASYLPFVLATSSENLSFAGEKLRLELFLYE
jgi:hypothetical protein